MTIFFHNSSGENACLSNFSSHGFVLDGYFWKTSEHYFQSQKFFGSLYADTIRQAKTPKEAFKLGNSRKYKIRPDWELVKKEVMFKCVLEKFKTHADIRQFLLDTGEQDIIEMSDPYWGCGADQMGKNQLGKILMHVREILRQDNK